MFLFGKANELLFWPVLLKTLQIDIDTSAKQTQCSPYYLQIVQTSTANVVPKVFVQILNTSNSGKQLGVTVSEDIFCGKRMPQGQQKDIKRKGVGSGNGGTANGCQRL